MIPVVSGEQISVSMWKVTYKPFIEDSLEVPEDKSVFSLQSPLLDA